MPQGPKDYLALGDWNAYCDGCHFKFKASELRKDWQGYMKCGPCFETRHPMDFQKPPRPSTPVPWTRSNDDAGPRQDVAGDDIVISISQTIQARIDATGGTIPAGTNDGSL